MACLFYYLEAEAMEAGPDRKQLLERSLVHADQALDVYAGEFTVLEYRARCLDLLNRQQEAAATFDKLTGIDPSNTGWLRMAATHAYRNDYREKAIKYYEMLAAADPDDIDASIDLTQLYNSAGRFDDAMALNQILYDQGHHYDALLNFGDVYIAASDTAAALAYYDSAISIKVENYIVEEALRISRLAKNDTLSAKLVRLLNSR
jgi:tetratricopeptide (TPR) repeat protein